MAFYNIPLPSIRKLRQLAEWGGPFPIQSRHLVLAGERFDLGDKVIHFLELFPKDTIFESREDFLYQCYVIEQYLRANRTIPMQFIEFMYLKNESKYLYHPINN